MLFLGIDPGLAGALAWVGDAGAWCVPMPVVAGKRRSLDLGALRDLVAGDRPDVAAVELASPAPVRGRAQGALSMFSFGRGFGQVEGVLCGLGVPFVLVTPQAWKSDLLRGTARDKAAAVAFCKRRFPGVPLRATPRCRADHDGLADALCLALYARRSELGAGAERPGEGEAS